MAKNFDPEIGKNTRWKKGQRSPNPGGRPRYSAVSAYLREALDAGDANKIATSLLRLAKKGNMRAISEVIDRTEGKATQPLEGAVERSQPDSPDLLNMSDDEVVEQFVDVGVRLIRKGLETLNDQLLDDEVLHLRKATPRLQELHQGLTNLIRKLEERGLSCVLEGEAAVAGENTDIEQAKRSGWRTVEAFPGGGSVKVYVGP